MIGTRADSDLGRYTRRVAISNDRILSCDDESVTFSYRDRADGNRQKQASVDGTDFIQRFLTHVLPSRFLRIRHYGFRANRGKQQSLGRSRLLLGAPPASDQAESPKTAGDWMQLLLGLDINCCPCCHGPLVRQTLLPVQPHLQVPSPQCRGP